MKIIAAFILLCLSATLPARANQRHAPFPMADCAMPDEVLASSAAAAGINFWTVDTATQAVNGEFMIDRVRCEITVVLYDYSQTAGTSRIAGRNVHTVARNSVADFNKAWKALGAIISPPPKAKRKTAPSR